MRVEAVIAIFLVFSHLSMCRGTRRQRSGTRPRNRQRNPHNTPACNTIEAAVRFPDEGGLYFFSRDRFIEYDEDSGNEKRTGPMRRLGLDQQQVQAAFRHPVFSNQIVLTLGCDYHRYNISRRNHAHSINTGRLSDLGLPCDLDVAFNAGESTLATKGCAIWTFNTQTGLFIRDEARSLENIGAACSLDAAVEVPSEQQVVLISGHRFWKWNNAETTDFVPDGPFHTDDLNICSWFICGEADFSRPQPEPGRMACNGDTRLCPLRLDQVTLPGLHNAGAGFDRGFGFLNCWVRNHAKSIEEQLELGIRHLDIDPCYDTCGFLGTCHSYFCGGSICTILKQTRRFLLQHPNEVVTINFNHEIVEPAKVFRELTRQLKIQLGPLLSSAYRRSGFSHPQWPTLGDSIESNQRLVVFYSWDITRDAHISRFRRHPWIHTESWLGSTWDEVQVTTGCRELLGVTERMCGVREHRQMVEVSAIPTSSFGTCVTDIADMCRPRLIELLQICQPYRYRRGKSPNVLLVDYPEVNTEEVTSVFHAVYLQNVRNVLQHRPSQCRMNVYASVTTSDGSGLFFSGTALVTYGFDKRMQVDKRSLPQQLHHIEAAYMEPGQDKISVVKDCQVWKVDANNLLNTSQAYPLSECSQRVDAAVVWRGLIHLFQDCTIVTLGTSGSPQSTDQWGLPCSVDAALTSPDGVYVYVFKGGYYWKYDGNNRARLGSIASDWVMDAVSCDDWN